MHPLLIMVSVKHLRMVIAPSKIKAYIRIVKKKPQCVYPTKKHLSQNLVSFLVKMQNPFEKFNIVQSKKKKNYILTEKANQVVWFDSIKDWRQELERTKGNLKYKAVSVNEDYKVSKK